MCVVCGLEAKGGMVLELRPYQTDVLNDIRAEALAGHKRIMLQAATGSGKTIIAADVMRHAAENGNRVLFLAHRRELINQCADKLTSYGIPNGIIMAGEERNLSAPVQVASVQTIWHRAWKKQSMDFPDADLLIIDEAHRCMSKTYEKIIHHYKDAFLLGLTATPIRADGKGLGNLYTTMVKCPSFEALADLDFLVRPKYYAPSKPDLDGIKITAGDYNEKQLEERMDKPKLIGDVVENWVKCARDRKTIVFASGVRHSIHLVDQFRLTGIRAAHIDGDTPYDERRTILKDFAEGDLEVICNAMVLTEGWDCPVASCGILARPTRSLGLYVQMAGRILRPWPGKENALLIDHSGAIYEHGLLHELPEWELDVSFNAPEKIREIKKKRGSPITCGQCKYVFWAMHHCPECGWIPQKFGTGVVFKEGRLFEVDSTGKTKVTISKEDKQDWYSQILGFAEERGYRRGWVAHTYRKKFGVWPRGLQDIDKAASLEVKAFIVSQLKNYKNMVTSATAPLATV